MLANIARIPEALVGPSAETVLKQTRQRIDEEKEAPNGGPWMPVSTKYATSNPGRTMLERSGALLNSIQVLSESEDGFSVGSTLEYAARQNFARPFLGLSAENVLELDAVIAEVMDQVLS